MNIEKKSPALKKDQKKSTEKKDPFMEMVRFFIETTIIIFAVLLIRFFLITPFQISGSSMESAYHDKEFILIDRFSYHMSDPKRWDVAVFSINDPAGMFDFFRNIRLSTQKPQIYYIKRVIGLPGDTIKISEGKVFIKTNQNTDFIEIDEPYLSEKNLGKTFSRFEKNEFLVPEGYYFLLGDNRGNSSDSRTCFKKECSSEFSFYMPRENFLGKVWIDFGYFQVFSEESKLTDISTWEFGSFSFIHKPWWFNTIREWNYNELWE